MKSRISFSVVSGNGCCFAPAAVEAAKSETKDRALRLMNLPRGGRMGTYSLMRREATRRGLSSSIPERSNFKTVGNPHSCVIKGQLFKQWKRRRPIRPYQLGRCVQMIACMGTCTRKPSIKTLPSLGRVGRDAQPPLPVLPLEPPSEDAPVPERDPIDL